MTFLGETGTVYVTGAAGDAYAAATGMPLGRARRELTALLTAAHRVEGDRDLSPERWRYRSRSTGWDIGAHVTRAGPLAVVVHAHVRQA